MLVSHLTINLHPLPCTLGTLGYVRCRLPVCTRAWMCVSYMNVFTSQPPPHSPRASQHLSKCVSVARDEHRTALLELMKRLAKQVPFGPP